MSTSGAFALAGGTDLIPQVREGRRKATLVVDLKKIPAMTEIAKRPDGCWHIGAAASIASLGAVPGFANEHPGLLAAARLIGSLQIQSRATLGGNLANGAPSADAVPLLISLEAEVEIAGKGGTRTMAVGDFVIGPGRNALQPGELLVAIRLPATKPRSSARYLRFTPRREMDIAVAGSGVAITLLPSGEVSSARITLASVAPVPLRAKTAETSLIGKKLDMAAMEVAGRNAAAEASPISDTRSSADYRRHLVAVLTRRALEACREDIEGSEIPS